MARRRLMFIGADIYTKPYLEATLTKVSKYED